MVKKSTLSSVNYLLLCLAVAIYSLSGLFSKAASFYDFLSPKYTLSLVAVVGVLGIYAVLWQIALKRVPLSQAYPFRSLGVVYGLAIAYFAFHEDVTWQNLIGAIIVLSGLLIITTGK